MLQITSDQIQAARDTAALRWQSPYRGFASGFDTRTSDNALLVQIYGGLNHAANHEWLNAGRRLIDKTYINMLWHVQSLLPMSACSPESISAALDNFILEHIRPIWLALPKLSDSKKQDLAESLAKQAATALFGSLKSEVAASRLLFILCPTLPIYNLSLGNQLALRTLGYAPADNSYPAFVQSCNAGCKSIIQQIESLALPQPAFGSLSEQALISELLHDHDWWTRRVFDALLQQIATEAYPDHSLLFSCTSRGQLPAL